MTTGTASVEYELISAQQAVTVNKNITTGIIGVPTQIDKLPVLEIDK